MSLSSGRWKRYAESKYPHEREALEYLRENLPDSDPVQMYSNFEFIADDGSVNEVDALVVTRAGLFLVEIKSRDGKITGKLIIVYQCKLYVLSPSRGNWPSCASGVTLSPTCAAA